MSRIEAVVLKDLKPVRPLPSVLILFLLCGVVFLGVVWIGAATLGMTGWQTLSAAQRTAVFTALGASGLLLAMTMIGEMVPGSRLSVAARSIPAATLVTTILVVAAMFRPRTDSSFVATGLVCLRNGMTYSIPAFLLFGVLVRFGAMLNPKVIGAAAGSLAGFAALAALEMNCPNQNVFHRVVWHCGVVLINSTIATLVGVVIEKIELRRRPQVS